MSGIDAVELDLATGGGSTRYRLSNDPSAINRQHFFDPDGLVGTLIQPIKL